MFRLCTAAVFAAALATFAHGEDFQASDWEVRLTGPGSGAQHAGDGIALMYRPHLLSKSEWKPSTLSFDWQCPPSVKADDGRTYGDHLCVFLSSDGTFRKERSYEALTGIVVRIDSTTGDIRIQKAVDGVSFSDLASVKGAGPLDPEKAHAVVITDDGKTISATLGTTTVKAEIPADVRKGKVWGFYNREPVGPAKNISRLRNISLK